MHDHTEKIHTCKKCGYWHVANGRFQTVNCPKCKDTLSCYASKHWIVENESAKFAQIPDNLVLGQSGFIML